MGVNKNGLRLIQTIEAIKKKNTIKFIVANSNFSESKFRKFYLIYNIKFNQDIRKNMGSIEAACIAGFLCRLCSEMHRTVIHIYGDQGQKRGLATKINAYLPVTVCKIVLVHVNVSKTSKSYILFHFRLNQMTNYRKQYVRLV